MQPCLKCGRFHAGDCGTKRGPTDAQIEAAARAIALYMPDAFSSRDSFDGTAHASLAWPKDWGANEQAGFRAAARAALVAGTNE